MFGFRVLGFREEGEMVFRCNWIFAGEIGFLMKMFFLMKMVSDEGVF